VLPAIADRTYGGLGSEIASLPQGHGSALVMVALEDSILTCGSSGCGTPKLLYRTTTGSDGQAQATLILISTADHLEIASVSSLANFELYAFSQSNTGLDEGSYRVELLRCAAVCVPIGGRSLDSQAVSEVDGSNTDGVCTE